VPAYLQRLNLPLALAAPAAGLVALAVVTAYRTDPVVPAIAAATLGAAVLALSRPMAVLYLAIAAIPLELYSLPVGGALRLTPTEALFVLAALGWSLQRLAEGRLPLDPGSPLTKPFALLLLAVLPGLVIADDNTVVLKVLAAWTVFFLLYQMIVAEGSGPTVRNLLIALGFAGAVSGAIAVISTGGGTHQEILAQGEYTLGRATGEFLTPNHLAMLLGLSLPGSLGLALKGPPALRPAALVAFALALTGLALTLSRAVQLAVGGALLLMLWWRPLRRAAMVALVALLTLVGAAGISVGSLPAANSIAARFESLPETGSGNPRWEVWADAVDQFAEHPLFGVGAGNFRSRRLGADSPDPGFNQLSAAGVTYGQIPPHAHNIALGFAAQLGLLGLAALGWVSVVLIRLTAQACKHLRGAERAWAFAVAAALATVALDGLLDDNTSNNALAVLTVILSGCAVVLSAQVRDTGADEEREPPPRQGAPDEGAEGGQRGDSEERIEIVARRAARAAERRAMAEILRLREELKRTREETAETLQAFEARVREAEQRAWHLELGAQMRQHRIGEAEDLDRRAVSTEDQTKREAGVEPARAEREERLPAGTPQREASDLISLNAGSFEEYRELGMSVTQAKRVIAYRERLGGYSSIDDLDRVPGFPKELRAELKRKLTV
jgi:O-antigen ligase/DNA uptake protein ComE-like DNA-binding protein